MGRTNPTYRDAIRRLEDRWSDYRRALRPADRDRFDRLVDDAREHADAGGNLNPHDPVVPVLLSMLLVRERRIDDLEGRIGDCQERVDDLGDRTDDLEAGTATLHARVEALEERVEDVDDGADGGTGRRSAAGIRTLVEYLDDEA